MMTAETNLFIYYSFYCNADILTSTFLFPSYSTNSFLLITTFASITNIIVKITRARNNTTINNTSSTELIQSWYNSSSHVLTPNAWIILRNKLKISDFG